MIYVEILGRMGNQMFSYAFARNLQLHNKRQQKEKIAFDFSCISENDRKLFKNGYNELVHFQCGSNIIEQRRKLSILQRGALYLYARDKCRKSISGELEWLRFEQKWNVFLNMFGIYLCSLNYHKFFKNVFFKNLMVIGFYESPLFFEEINDEIKNEFQLKEIDFSEKTNELIDEIENSESVCVGIRKGDFESDSNKKNYSVCSNNYYERAMALMRKKVSKPRFFVFTDDIGWTRDSFNFPIDAVFVIDDEFELKPYQKIHVMSRCKHAIIPNSTYNWWAQHLSENKNGVVIAPDRWRNITPEAHTDIYETRWVTIAP